MKPSISIVAALSQNRVIGNKGRIPWHIKEDLVRLKNLTKDNVVIVGRKTYESMILYYDKSGRDMPGKNYIILTSHKNYQPTRKNSLAVQSLAAALQEAEKIGSNEVFIIGGAQIFNQALSQTDKLYLTIVKGNFEGDTYFPDYAEFKTEVYKKESRNDKYEFTFLDLIR